MGCIYIIYRCVHPAPSRDSNGLLKKDIRSRMVFYLFYFFGRGCLVRSVNIEYHLYIFPRKR